MPGPEFADFGLPTLLRWLATASALFLPGIGLSLVLAATRFAHVAHGAIAMLGLAVAVVAAGVVRSAQAALGLPDGVAATGLAAGVGLAVGMAVAAGGGVALERWLLRRLRDAAEPAVPLAGFGILLLLRDVVGTVRTLLPGAGVAASGPTGTALGLPAPVADLALAACGVLAFAWLVVRRGREGRAGAPRPDRPFARAARAFALAGALATLAAVLQPSHRTQATGFDLAISVDAFLVALAGGAGSVPGAAIASLALAAIRLGARAWGLDAVVLGGMPVDLGPLAEFAAAALLLALRPTGLATRAAVAPLPSGALGAPPAVSGGATSFAALVIGGIALALAVGDASPRALGIGIDVLAAVLLVASLQVALGLGALASFAQGAWFALGALGVALAGAHGGVAALAALPGAALVAGAAGCLLAVVAVPARAGAGERDGARVAMVTLAFAQVVHAALRGAPPVAPDLGAGDPLADPRVRYLVVLLIVLVAVRLLRRLCGSPFGVAVRAARDDARRAQASGIDAAAVHRVAVGVAAAFAALAGGLSVFAMRGAVAPFAPERSFEAVLALALGGVHALAGPLLGAGLLAAWRDTVLPGSWHAAALAGGLAVALAVRFPQGMAGRFAPWRAARVGGRAGSVRAGGDRRRVPRPGSVDRRASR